MVRTQKNHLSFFAGISRLASIASITGVARSIHRAPAGRFERFARVTGMAVALGAGIGCESGGVGDPCTPEDEFFEDFSGFAVGEVNVESRSFQCETRVCLVNKFRGRVSCPYGTNGTPPPATDGTPTVNHDRPCEVPGFGGYVTVPVEPQLIQRSPEVAVYCSCRCDGADPNARYCECPSGFECAEIVTSQTSQNSGQEQLAGSYCIRSGSDVDVIEIQPQECSIPSGTVQSPEDLTCGTPPNAI